MLYILLVIILIPAALSLAVQTSYVQTRVTSYFINQLSDKLGTDVEIGKVDIAFFNKLVVEKLYIEDYHGDTLIYIDKINIAINNFNRKERKIDFGLISIDKLKLSLYKDTANLNLNVLIDSLINKDSKTEKWKTIFSKLEINNSILRYKTHKYSPKDFGMNYSDIEANKLNLTISDVQIGDTLKLDISELRFLEKSGLRIRQMKTVLSLSNKHINLDNLHISFDNSEIKANMLTFRFDSVSAFSKFNSKIRIEADFYDTEFSFTDLAFFAPQLRDFDEKIVFTSSFSGTINDLRTRNFQMVYGKDTRLRATMSLIGLPNIEHTFLYADIQEFCTSSSDIQSIQLPGKLSEQSILLPDQFDEVGLIKYKGNLTGFTNDFVAYGTISSNLGIISTDLGLKKTKQNYSFHGGIKTINFDLGKFAGPNSGLGKIDMEMQVDGYIDSLNKVIAEPNGVIHNIEFNNYIYSNVEMNGKLNGKKFEGFVYVSEPDIDLDFSGAIDFSEDIPVFDFNAVLTNARLDKLNFYKNDSLPELSFIMQSNFTGNTIDNFQGNINLWDVKYSNAKNKVTVEELSLTAYTEDSINSIKLRSGIADVSVTGQYSLKGLSKSLPEYFYHFYPSFKSKKQITETNDSLQFSIQIKESADIFDMIMPGFSIGKGSEIIGNFNSAKNILNIHGDFTNIEAESFLFNNIKLSSKNDNESLFIFLSSNSVLRSEKEFLNSINLSAKFLTDSLHTHIDWFHKDSLTYEGNLSTAVSFSKNDSCSIPKAEIELLPSTIILADSTWHLSNANFVVDRELFSVSNFMFHRAEQYFKLESSGTPLTSDTLFMQLQNIPLSNLNVFTLEKGFDLKGIINGNASLTNIFSKPVFFSDISISGFEVNKKKLGTAFVLSGWDKQNKQLKITSYTQRNKIKPFFIEGNYIPENDKLDFNIIFDRFYLSIFEPYLEKNISGLGGIISDTLQLSGSIKYPVLNGRLKIQKAGFVLDYLNTHYNFSDYVDFRKNSIQFDKIEIFDTRNEKAVVTGELSHNYFRDFTMDINIDASNFTLLNTSESENSIYYGKAYGSGNVAISGSFELVDIEIDMKTEKGTDFSIPLSTGSEISESNFITFINTNSEDNTEEEEIADLSGVSLKMDLEVTPDAEVQLIFASKMGDIIKGKGTSNLKLEISANHEFNMYGDYYIEEGEYTLSIGDFLSKHFIVKPGGSISWNGDPYDANINLETYYKLNAALQDLYLDSSEVYRKRVPVECQIHMTNDLMNPDIKFAIDLPKSSESDRAQLRNLPSDELNKQFISLLFINRFQPLPGLDFGNAVNFSSGYSLSESTSELLSNQLSHWLSQISNDFDIGFAYRPGDEVSSDEVEVALETQFFNQRLTVNGNVGMGGQYENTNSMVGDVEANLKLNEAGKLRVKAFRRSNTNFDYEKGPTTQGVGVFYREEFDTFADLMRKLLKLNQDKE